MIHPRVKKVLKHRGCPGAPSQAGERNRVVLRRCKAPGGIWSLGARFLDLSAGPALAHWTVQGIKPLNVMHLEGKTVLRSTSVERSTKCQIGLLATIVGTGDDMTRLPHFFKHPRLVFLVLGLHTRQQKTQKRGGSGCEWKIPPTQTSVFKAAGQSRVGCHSGTKRTPSFSPPAGTGNLRFVTTQSQLASMAA